MKFVCVSASSYARTIPTGSRPTNKRRPTNGLAQSSRRVRSFARKGCFAKRRALAVRLPAVFPGGRQQRQNRSLLIFSDGSTSYGASASAPIWGTSYRRSSAFDWPWRRGKWAAKSCGAWGRIAVARPSSDWGRRAELRHSFCGHIGSVRNDANAPDLSARSRNRRSLLGCAGSCRRCRRVRRLPRRGRSIRGRRRCVRPAPGRCPAAFRVRFRRRN